LRPIVWTRTEVGALDAAGREASLFQLPGGFAILWLSAMARIRRQGQQGAKIFLASSNVYFGAFFRT
jgi:hypothetical protein